LLLAASDPQALLAAADKLANGYQDQHIVMRMIVDDNGATKQARLETMQKGGKKRFIRFLAPGDVKGMAILIEDRQSMYVYLPQFQKVRRIAGHARNQSFMDADFSNDDMGAINFSDDWLPTLESETDSDAKVRLKPKPGVDSEFDSLLVTIDKKSGALTQIDYFHGDKAVRRQSRSFKDANVSSIVMEDLTRKHKTTLEMELVENNKGLPDSLFTKQALERQR
jgi:outer membrane lipoprotein-sorting protein